jgi:YVTN family beta-propeller protein
MSFDSKIIRIGLLAAAISLLFSEIGLAQSVLTFSRAISAESVETQISVSNPNASDAPVTFTAFSPDGSILTGDGIQNPITLTVPAAGQLSKQLEEIFNTPSGGFNGWVQGTSSVSGLTGFYLNTNPSLTDMDGSASVTPATESVLPFAVQDSNARTEVTIINRNNEPANVTAILYGLDGSVIATANVTLPASGLVRQTLDALFGPVDFSNASHIKIQGDRPLVANEVVANYLLPGSNTARETINLAGQPTGSGQTYVIPHFVSGAGWLSMVGLANAGGVAQDLVLTAYQQDGTLWPVASNPKRLVLPANSGLRATMETLFGSKDDSMTSGWLEVTSSVGFLVAYVAYGNVATPSFAVNAATDASSAAKLEVLSPIFETTAMFSGVTVVNAGKSPAAVDFYMMRTDGSTIGKASVTLGPNQLEAQLFRDLLPASLGVSGGWAYLSSSQPLVAASLIGTSNGAALAAIPQQFSGSGFVPPSQTTGAVSGMTLAGTNPLAGVEVALSGPVNVTAITDNLGEYTFGQLPAGSYVVSASFAGAVFDPPVANISINQQNVVNIDFQAGGLAPAEVPIAADISPAATFMGNTALNIDILGQNFTPTSVVSLNGQTLQTTFISPTELQAVIPSTQFSASQNLSISIQTPPPGGGVSSPLTLVVNPIPKDPLIVGRIPTGSNPAGVAFDTKRTHVLVSDESGDSVTIVDLATLKSVASVKVGRSPADGLAIDAAKDIALVANPGSDDVSVIDLTTNTQTSRIKVTTSSQVAFPLGLAIDPGLNRAYVANNAAGNIPIIDLNKLTLIGSIPVAQGISNIAINTATHIGIVTNLIANTATFFDTSANKIVATIGTGQRPRGVAINSTTNQAVIVNSNSNDAWIIDMASRTVLTKIPVGTGPTGVAIHLATNSAIVTNSSVAKSSHNQFGALGSVSVIDLASYDVTRASVGAAAFGIDVDPADQESIIADFGSNDVTILRIPNPVPRVTDVEPKTFPAGGATFTVTINGTGFLRTSVAAINGHNLATTYVSTTQLKAVVTSSVQNQLLQSSAPAGSGPSPMVSSTSSFQISIGVTNPVPGGGTSPADIKGGDKIAPTNVLPVLLSMTPKNATLGSDLTLTLTGNNFNTTSVLNFGGTLYSPVTVTPTSMKVVIPKANLSPGSFAVSISNPPPGGGTTSQVTLTISAVGNPTPGIISVSPTSITVGAAATTVIVQGSGFIASTTGSLAGVAGVFSGNAISFAIPANQLSSSGTLSGVVTTPGPGGGTAPFSINVLNVKPTISSFTPNTFAAGALGAVLVVTGTNFVQGSRVTVAGTAVTTTYNSPTQLTATVTSAFFAHAGTFPIGVTNPAPGGGSAVATLKLTVNNPIPTLKSFSPTRVTAGQATSVTVSGTNFVSTSAISVNGTLLPTTYVTSTLLVATLPATLQAGTASVTVVNPAPGGGSSNVIAVEVLPAPAVREVTFGLLRRKDVLPER